MTPLGKPMLPDVYKTTATSSSLTFKSGQLSADVSNASSIDVVPSISPLTTKLTFKFFAKSYLL